MPLRDGPGSVLLQGRSVLPPIASPRSRNVVLHHEGLTFIESTPGQGLPCVGTARARVLRHSALFRELREPPIVTVEMMESTFGRVPGLLTPPAFPDEQVARLAALA